MWFFLRRRNYGSFFAANRKTLDFLFRAAAGAIMGWCQDNGLLPGIVAVLHTFGGEQNFQPHIHILLTLGGLGKSDDFDFNLWQENTFFPEKQLKASFRYSLLKNLQKLAKKKLLNIPSAIKQGWWKKHKTMKFYEVAQILWKIIWYVYIGEKLDNAVYTAKYIGRYAKRPCLSEINITNYDPAAKTVAFRYRDKIEKIDKTINLSVEEFIGRLIRHIPEKHFRMIRYYGIYANRVKNELRPLLLLQITALYTIAKLIFEPRRKTWRQLKREATGRDPLICPNCNVLMDLISITYKTRDGPFKTVYIF